MHYYANMQVFYAKKHIKWRIIGAFFAGNAKINSELALCITNYLLSLHRHRLDILPTSRGDLCKYVEADGWDYIL